MEVAAHAIHPLCQSHFVADCFKLLPIKGRERECVCTLLVLSGTVGLRDLLSTSAHNP
jgi:hypothetical protein